MIQPYSSPQMREIWTEQRKLEIWLQTELLASEALADEGLALATQADGLAVSRPSHFVGQLMESILAGCYTLEDKRMYRYVAELHESEGLKVELSAAAGCAGPAIRSSPTASRPRLRSRTPRPSTPRSSASFPGSIEPALASIPRIFAGFSVSICSAGSSDRP